MPFPSPNSEAAARAALESVAARAMTDAEWERARGRLVEFVTMLRHWNRQAEGTKKCRPDKVVTMGVETCESVLDKAA
jgi:hypothetical protein